MLIGVSGKIGSGKDTVGEIIQIMINSPHFTDETVLSFIGKPHLSPKWEIKKFADKTTKAFYIITGINYHILNREEKEKIRPTYIKFAEGQKDLFENDDIWCNSLMSEYRPYKNYHNARKYEFTWFDPNWIITDMRFTNELKAIEDRQGITIRVNRPCFTCKTYEGKYCSNSYHLSNKHESETALDNAEFLYTIDNNGTLLQLIRGVREILTKEKII